MDFSGMKKAALITAAFSGILPAATHRSGITGQSNGRGSSSGDSTRNYGVGGYDSSRILGAPGPGADTSLGRKPGGILDTVGRGTVPNGKNKSKPGPTKPGVDTGMGVPGTGTGTHAPGGAGSTLP